MNENSLVFTGSFDTSQVGTKVRSTPGFFRIPINLQRFVRSSDDSNQLSLESLLTTSNASAHGLTLTHRSFDPRHGFV